jgi:hypothetical protein
MSKNVPVLPQLTVAELLEALCEADPKAVVILKSAATSPDPDVIPTGPDVIQNLFVVRAIGPVIVFTADQAIVDRELLTQAVADMQERYKSVLDRLADE